MKLTPLSASLLFSKKTPKFKRFGDTASKKNAISKTTKIRKRWVLFFILTLVVLPTTLPARADVLDPLIKVFLPFYERITGKDDAPSQDTQAETPMSTATAEPVPPPVSTPSPTPDLLTLLQAEFALDRDSPDIALQLYKAEALKDNATAVFERALELSMQLESPQESLAFAKAWQDQNTDHVPVWFYVTHLALKAEDYPTAAQNIKLILAYDSKADLSQIFAGILPHSFDAKRALFTELQSIDKDENPSLSVLKAGLLGQLNEPIPAILHLNNAIAADKNNLAYYLLKADILKDQNDPALSDFLKNSTKTTTGDTKKQLYLYHAQHLIDRGELLGAWQVLASSGKLLENDSEMALLGSLIALDIHRHEDANRLLLILAKNPATQSEAYYYLGISHERMEDYKTALSYFSKVDDMQFILPAAKKQVAYELLFDNPEGAIDSLVRLRQNFEMYAGDSYILQADTLIRLNRKDEARALLDTAHQEYPDDLTLLYAKVQLMDAETEYDDKFFAISSLLDFDPQNPSYQLAMAQLLFTKNPNDAEALQIAKAVSQMSFDNPSYDSAEQLNALILLADTAYNQGEYQAVIDYLQTPHELSPNLKTGTLLLRAYQKLGKGQKVQELLADLQHRFGGNSSSQEY